MNEMQSLALLLDIGKGYRTTASGLAPNIASPFEGIPVPGGPQGAQALAMLLGPQFQRMMSQAGLTGMGLGHDQNIYDRFQAQQQQTLMQEQLRAASQFDRSSYMNTFQGLAALHGTPMGGQQRLSANRLADLAVSFSPWMAQNNPDILDQLSGSRGSATVMASRLANFGRYRLDPVTGQMGNDPKSTEALTSNIMKEMYAESNLSNMKGITAGQLGSIAEQLSLRGLMGGAEFGREGLLRNLKGIQEGGGVAGQQLTDAMKKIPAVKTDARTGKLDLSGISATDLDALTQDSNVATKLRDFDASKVKNSLKAYVGAIAAMRDIFGDAGHPNAPVPALMQALESMTTGAMGQVDPTKLGQMARQTYYLAKTAGISADSAMVIQQDAASRGQQLGIEAPFAIHATQDSLGFNAALRSSGALTTPVFGGMTEAQLTQTNSNMTVQGAASIAGTRIGTLARIRKIVAATPDSDLSRVFAAIDAGQAVVKLKDGRDLDINRMTGTDVEAIGMAAGMTRDSVQAMLSQKAAAREQLEKDPALISFIRKTLQPAELRSTLSSSTSTTLAISAQTAGLNVDEKMGKDLAKTATELIGDLSKENISVRRDSVKRMQFIKQKLATALPPAMLAKLYEGKTTQQEKDAVLSGLAENLSGNLDETVSQHTNLGNYANAETANDRAILSANTGIQKNVANQNKLRDVTSGVLAGSALRNLMTAIKDVDITDKNSLLKVIGRTMGGVDTARIGDALHGPLGAYQTKLKEVDVAQRQLNLAKTPEEQAKLQEVLSVKVAELSTATEAVRVAGEKVNAYSATGLTHADVASAETSLRGETNSLSNMQVLRGDNAKVTPEQENAFKVKHIAELKKATEKIANNPNLAGTEKQRNAKALLDEINAGRYDKTLTKEKLVAGIVEERKNIPPATDVEITATMGKYHIDKKQATELESIRRNALMLGIDTAELEAEGMRDADLAGADATTGPKIAEKHLQILRKQINTRQKDIDPVEAKLQYDKFIKSPNAQKLRDSTEIAQVDVNNVIARAFDAGTINKVGVSAAKEAEKLQVAQQRVENIVQEYAGGDITKLLLGHDLKNIDMTTKKGQAKYKEVLNEYNTARDQSAASLKALSDRLADPNGAKADANLSPADKEKYLQKAKEQQELVNGTAPDLIKRYRAAFGVGDKAEGLDELEKNLTKFPSRDKLARLISTQERMSALPNAEALQKAYSDAVANKTVPAFKATLGAPDVAERTITDLETMRINDFSSFKGDKGLKNLNQELQVLDTRNMAVSKAGGVTDINITGKLGGDFKIVGDRLITLNDCDLTARTIA